MELVIGIGLVCVGIFIYGYAMANSWEKKYKIKMGYYFDIPPEKAAKMKTIQGTCRFDDIESPINVGLRLSRGEKIYAMFENLNLMAYKRSGGFGFGGIFLRKRIAPAIYLRGGIGKFGLGKSLQGISNGTLYVTNKGVFFDGDKKNIKLPWDKIMREEIHRDGIQLEKSNGEPIVLNGSVDPSEAAKFSIIGRMYESL